MKCRPKKCRAACCYNVPFDGGELERFAEKIITPVVAVVPLGSAVVPFTVPLRDTAELLLNDMTSNKCPFLRHDCTCNIYADRPDVCRKFGEIEQLPCKYRKT